MRCRGIRAYPGDLNQVWANLLDNAIDAAPARTGVVRVRTGVEGRQRHRGDSGRRTGNTGRTPRARVRAVLHDEDLGWGPGSDSMWARRSVVDLHGGELCVASTPGDTRFTVGLPLTTVGTHRIVMRFACKAALRPARPPA